MSTNKNPVVTGHNKISEGAEKPWRRSGGRRRWLLVGSVAAVIVLGAALAFHFGLPKKSTVDATRHEVAAVLNVVAPVVAPAVAPAPTLTDLQRDVRQNPKSASAHAALAQAYFDKGLRQAGLSELDRALNLDPQVTNDRLVADLVGCFGTLEQIPAANAIATFHLIGAQEGLERLTLHKQYGVRAAALTTLQKLGRVSHTDYLHVWTMDLEGTSCDVKRHAVAKLGELGDRRALQPIKEARQKDDEATPWYRFKCIGGLADDAEKHILAQQPKADVKPAAALARR
jgi:tetratricopeptide (TPR) repeat protein